MTVDLSSRTIADRLHSASIHLLRQVRRDDEASGLSPARLSALSVIVFAGPLTLGELAAAEQVSAPTMSRLAAALEQDGLIRREPDDRDGRAVQLHATPRGRRLLNQARNRRIDRLDAHLGDLGDEELATLGRAADILERLFGRRPPA